MAKRPDNDSTMELSTSQLVPDQPDNDASVWGQVVVSPDQFSPQAPKPTKATKVSPVEAPAPVVEAKSNAAIWIFLAFVFLTAIAAAVIVVYM
jgi:hypothetical protein